MEPITLTPAMRDLGRHALGLPNKNNRAYRNHYVAGDDDVIWREMVALGAAREYPGSALTGGDPLFRLTQAGATACLRPNEGLGEVHVEARN